MFQNFPGPKFSGSKIFPNQVFLGGTLSNSNPTWNSTELELVGVDVVFQCHNKKKNNNNNKNPHLIFWDQNLIVEIECGSQKDDCAALDDI